LEHKSKDLHPEGSQPHPRQRFQCPRPIAKNNLIQVANDSQEQADGVTNHKDWEVLNLVQSQKHDFSCQLQQVQNEHESDLLETEKQAAVLV
jgi:hypothetical protein